MSSHQEPRRQEREGTIADLVARCLSASEEQGTHADIVEICREHPELVKDVERALRTAVRIPTLPSVTAASDPRIGSLLVDRYRLISRIGQGAMGTVYSATDLELSRQVAVKIVHHYFGDESKALARFDREASALASIQHENVVRIFDRGVTDEGSPFLVMELIDGVSCSSILDWAEASRATETARLANDFGLQGIEESNLLRQVVRWMLNIAAGISAAHSKGIYHRDIKPSNILIRRSGGAILLDFGIASTEGAATVTQTGAAVGTPTYMAPEVLSGKVQRQAAQDVYGIAATLYHLLTLSPPFKGSPSDILTALAIREPVPAFKVRPGLPRDAQAILDHGLARNPAARYHTVQDLRNDLEAFLDHRSVSVRPTSALVRLGRRACRSRLFLGAAVACLLYTSPSPRDQRGSRMPSSA